jgi:hypothetical protein
MMSTTNLYEDLPPRQFWRKAVAEQNVLTTTDLWYKKFDIDLEEKIASAGSCFAQHISKRMLKSGFNYQDLETAPPGLPAESHIEFSYSTYSARYGNIYTTAQLLELAEEAFGKRPSLDYSWDKNGCFIDPLRPNVEPEGLKSHDEVQYHRQFHLKKLKQLFSEMDVFIFTLGLTETWICNRSGRVLPVAPGVIAGKYDPDLHSFKNLSHSEIKNHLKAFIQLINEVQGSDKCKFLFTISPVPLTATATNQHALVATTFSKSTLRSVVGELYDEYECVDYFPSYEIISSSWSRGIFFSSNLRSIESAGVDAAMRVFFLQHNSSSESQVKLKAEKQIIPTNSDEQDNDSDDVMCEEELLEGFAK